MGTSKTKKESVDWVG